MKTSIKNTSILAFALALSASPLVAFGQADSDNQGATDTSSSQSSKMSSKSKLDSKSKSDAKSDSMSDDTTDAGMSGDEQGNNDVKAEDSAASSASNSDIFIASQKDDDWLTANLVGAYVNDSEGNSLGSIQNVLLDKNQKVRALVVGVGGFLGIGTKAVAVDIDEFEQSRGEDGSPELGLSASKEQLQEAPAFKSLDQQMAEEKAKAAQQKAKQNMQDQQQSTGGATSDGGGSAGGSGGASN